MNGAQTPATINEGTLDPSFGEGGVLLTPNLEPMAVLPLPLNKLLVVLYPPWPEPGLIKVARLNADGTYDLGFGVRGTVEIPVDVMFLSGGALPTLLPTPEGGWVIVARISGGLILVRQRQDGLLEESFGEKGVLIFLFDSSPQMGTPGTQAAVAPGRTRHAEVNTRATGNDGVCAVDPSTGKIFINGRAPDLPNPSAPAVWRLNPDGAVDMTFNGTGFVIAKPAGFEYQVVSNLFHSALPDGKMLLLGSYDQRNIPDAYHLFLMRFNQDGSIDSGFNGGLALTVQTSRTWPILRAMTVRASDGRIVIVGNGPLAGQAAGMILVLNASGSFNQVFNGGQPLYSNVGGRGASWRCCEIQDNGAIVVSGGGGVNGHTHRTVVIARILPDGTLDPAFNGKGWTQYKHDPPQDPENNDSGRMKTTADGRVVLCGFSDVDGGWVLRYLA